MLLPSRLKIDPWIVACAVVCALASVLAFLALPAGLGDVDGVNFARALERFDPLAQAPHPPGYPVYVAAGKLAVVFGAADPVRALSLPGLWLMPLAGVLLFAGVRATLGLAAALGALGLAVFSPAWVASVGWPQSDGLGLSLAAAAVGCLCLPSRGLRPVGALLLGLLLGVRLSYGPLVFGAAAVALSALPALRVRLSLAFGAGVALWLVPLGLLVDPGALVELCLGFAGDHLRRVGAPAGGAFAQPAAPLVERALSLAALLLSAAGTPRAWLAAPLAPLAALVSSLALAGWGLGQGGRLRVLVLAVLPYALWLLLGQNLAAVRHALPLVPVAGALSGALVAALVARAARSNSAAAGHAAQRALPRASTGSRPGWAVAVAGALPLLLLLAFSGRAALSTAREQGAVPPALSLSRWVIAHHGPAQLLVLAGDEARVFERLAPAYRVLRPVDAQVARAEACRALSLGVRVWFSSEAPGGTELSRSARSLARFSATGDAGPSRARLELFELTPHVCGARVATSAPASLAALVRPLAKERSQ